MENMLLFFLSILSKKYFYSSICFFCFYIFETGHSEKAAGFNRKNENKIKREEQFFLVLLVALCVKKFHTNSLSWLIGFYF